MKIPSIVMKVLTDYFRWLAAAVVALVLVFGYLGLIAQKIQTIRTTGFLEQKKVQAELDSRSLFYKDLRESVDRFTVALPPDKRLAVDEFIPSSPDFPGLLLTINNIAAAANLELDSITVSEIGQLAATGPTATSTDQAAATTPPSAQAAVAAGVNLQVQDATISIGGGQSYAAFKNFIALIESSHRLLDVVSLGFTLGTATEGQATAGIYSLHIRTYFLPPS